MSVDAFLDGVGHAVRCADGKAVRATCLYLGKLADVDSGVLEEIAGRTYAAAEDGDYAGC